MDFVNLHGEAIDWPALVQAGQRQRQRERQAGVVHRTPTVKNGYAAPPGTGPEGQACRDCAHKRSMQSRSGAKHYVKCELRRASWTHGEGTDILARSPACHLFQPVIG